MGIAMMIQQYELCKQKIISNINQLAFDDGSTIKTTGSVREEGLCIYYLLSSLLYYYRNEILLLLHEREGQVGSNHCKPQPSLVEYRTDQNKPLTVVHHSLTHSAIRLNAVRMDLTSACSLLIFFKPSNARANCLPDKRSVQLSTLLINTLSMDLTSGFAGTCTSQSAPPMFVPPHSTAPP